MAAGDLGSRDLTELDKSIRSAEQASRFEFSVYVGPVEGDPSTHARRLHSSLVVPTRSVLLLVDPEARVIEVVTGTEVRRHLTDREVEHAVLGMQADFAAGDLVGGLKNAIAMLAEHARPQRALHVG